MKPTAIDRKQAGPSDTTFDKEAHQKKIQDWFMNPVKFQKYIENEQRRHPNKCIYHLSKTHQTEQCAVKKECDRLVANMQNSTASSGHTPTSTAHLRHITEDEHTDSLIEETLDTELDMSGNDNNEEALLYFDRISKHYLRLVKGSSDTLLPSRHDRLFPVIADSGANYHMFRDKAFFTALIPATGNVILGDGTTSVSIQGIGTITCKVGSDTLTISNVRYIPDLSESVYSLLQHIKTPGHGLDSTFEQGMYLTFPTFKTKAIIGSDDIYLDMIPHSFSTMLPPHESAGMTSTDSEFCRHVTEPGILISPEAKIDKNTLQDLHYDYDTVQLKRSLSQIIPPGFRSSSGHQQQFILHTPPRKSADADLISQSDTENHLLENLTSNPIQNNRSVSLDSVLSGEQLSSCNSTPFIPIVRSVDKPSSSLPKTIAMSEDYLRSCVGFRRIDTLKRNMTTLYQPSITLDNMPPDAILDPGYLATLKKKDRNTTPVHRPKRFGDVIHIDIVFGPDISIGNVHYGLICVDRFSRMTYIYPLQNLTGDIQKQLEAFFAHLGMVPKRIISDFDLKLVGGRARWYHNSLLVHVNAAPSHHQDKNGLAERHWQTIISMARNWLASAELPSSFWFYAVKRAAEVCNYFPTFMDDGIISTPFELAHQSKPDLRVLFKPFTLAAVRQERVGNNVLEKFAPQSIPMIAIGRCPTSNGLQFYNPMNSTFVSSIDYTFQHNVTSGSRFGLKYQPGTFIYRLDESTTIFAPKFPLDSNVYVNTHSPPHLATVIGLPTYQNPDTYTVRFPDGTITEYLGSSDILTMAPMPPKANISILPHWIKGGCTATLFLNDMSKPNHGRLYEQEGGNWIFCTGNKYEISKGRLLQDLSATAQQLIDSGQLFRGHTKFTRVYQARQQTQLRTCVLRHVSAHGLQSLITPTSVKQHSSMSSTDKAIWDEAYCEEYDGLSSIPTWEVLSEDQFKLLSKGRKALPSMAISTIKYDANNKPKRAKYRIVVLGNLDYHNWSKESTAAPVMTQLELRLLTSMAVYHKRTLKNCDVKQAFVQSSLPPNEDYFVRPPVGCPKSPPGTYWKLLRSLYGLKRAPKLWYEKLSYHLKAMGLKCCANSPCLFYGSLIEGEPPIYIGIYVDDIIYFSSSDRVEKEFENRLSSIGEIDFMGQVSHFLGIEFTWCHHVDGNISVNLTQQSFVENLLDSFGYSYNTTSTFTSPYHSGVSIDSIPNVDMTVPDRDKLRLQYQSLVGSLNWLAHTTRPDISTVVSLLAQHQSIPSPGHLEAALHVVKYLSHTKTLGIHFSSLRHVTLESFLHFPVLPRVLPMSDANWGPQDASLSSVIMELPLFTSRSMSAFYVDLMGPLHWISKRQQVTACSSAEAEIYATNECVKFLLELVQILEFLEVKHIFMPGTTTVFNDNNACVNWAKRCTTKGLRHIQMRENHVRENVESQFVHIKHIGGKVNLADLFTKEMKDTTHFVELRDLMMRPRGIT